jgi:hypothetical protein
LSVIAASSSVFALKPSRSGQSRFIEVKKGALEMIAMVFGKASDAFAGKESAQGGTAIKPNVLILISG